MTTTPTAPTFEPVHVCWMAHITEAINNSKRLASARTLAPIVNGESFVCWDASEDRGHENRAASDLIVALVAQANRYDRDGLEISAQDCLWLVHGLHSGDLTVIPAYLLK
jgi:hypothetical protein